MEGPASAPSSLAADSQESDGTTIVIASVTLPSAGFIAIHGDAEGEPGARGRLAKSGRGRLAVAAGGMLGALAAVVVMAQLHVFAHL